jgi:hypothetical protein
MTLSHFGRLAALTGAIALLAACGGSQPPIARRFRHARRDGPRRLLGVKSTSSAAAT